MKKRVISMMLMFSLLISISSVSAFAKSSDVQSVGVNIIGDANVDGDVNVKDATEIQKHIAGISKITGDTYYYADVDNDNELTIKDTTEIQKYSAELITEFVRKTVGKTTENTNQYGLAKDLEQGSIFHAWCWSFNTIKKNLENLAASGFTSIQTSPISQCLVGEDGGMEIYGAGKWYYHYQPTKFVIGNYQLGTQAEFTALCDAAHKLGMNIIVDAVVNHCSREYEAIDSDIKNIAGGAFHSTEGIWWSQENRYYETQGQLDRLWDLNTQNPNVQNMIKNYLVSCVQAGADGFRYDTAKLIELPDDSVAGKPSFASDFWTVCLDNGAKFQYGEDLQDAEDNSVCRLSDYAKIMDVTASLYGEKIRDAVNTDNLNSKYLEDYEVDGLNPDSLVTWVESHDNYCNNNSWSYIDEQESIQAWAIIAARKGGTPLYFSRPMNSTSENPWGDNQMAVEGSDLYRDNQIAQVNFFRNEMGKAEEYLSNPNGDDKVLMIERGTKGCVIINTNDTDLVLNNQAVQSMANGTYTDQVSGTTFVVANGKISGKVGAGRVAVIYNKESTSLPGSSKVSLSVATSNFYTDTLSVNIIAKNCTDVKYQLNNGEAISAKDGTVVTVGEGMLDASTIKLTVTGTDTNGKQITKSSTYTKCVSKGNTKIYFDKKAYSTWGDVYAYVYDEDDNYNSAWPGVKMENIGNSIYNYTLPYKLESKNCSVIFNNGYSGEDNQYPVKGGLAVKPGENKLFNYIKEWEDYPLKTLYFKNTGNWNTVNAYYWGDENSSWPGVPAAKVNNTSDIYAITLFGDATSVIFNDGNGNQTRDIDCFINGQMFAPTSEYTVDKYDQKIYEGQVTQYTDDVLGEQPADTKQIFLRAKCSWFNNDNPYVYANFSETKVLMTQCANSSVWTAYIPKDTQNIYFTRCDADGLLLNNLASSLIGDNNCYTVLDASGGVWNDFGTGIYPNSWTVYFDNSVCNYTTPYIFAWGGDGLDGFAKLDYVEGSIYSYTFIDRPKSGELTFLFSDGNDWTGNKTCDTGYDGSHNCYNGTTWSTYTLK